MAEKIKLVQGDTRPALVISLTDENSGAPQGIDGSTCRMYFRAYSKQTDGGDASLAVSHYGAFTSSLTGKTQAETVLNPNSAAPANPNA